MDPLRRLLTACALAAVPALTHGQMTVPATIAALALPPAPAVPAPPIALSAAIAMPGAPKADGLLRYSLNGGGSYLSATTTTAARAGIGGEGTIATNDNRWRFGGKAVWTRSAGETAAETMTLLVSEESQHRCDGGIWLRQKLSLFPALRAGESVRAGIDAGVSMAMNPLMSINVGMTRSFDGNAPLKWSDAQFVTGIAIKLF